MVPVVPKPRPQHPSGERFRIGAPNGPLIWARLPHRHVVQTPKPDDSSHYLNPNPLDKVLKAILADVVSTHSRARIAKSVSRGSSWLLGSLLQKSGGWRQTTAHQNLGWGQGRALATSARELPRSLPSGSTP